MNNTPQDLTKEPFGSMENFKARYLELVTTEMKKLREDTLGRKDIIFAANSYPEFDRSKANFAWREDLYGDITKVLKAIARQLALELKDEALKLVEYMTELLWGSEQVKLRLIGQSETEFLTKLETCLSVLFLRFARPVAEVLIRGPVGSDTREKIVNSLGADIEIVDNYYQGDEAAFKVLKKYVKYGSNLLFNKEIRQQVLGLTSIAVGTTIINELTSPQELVVFEVTQDINAFEEYLRHGIFAASGFESYCLQEMKGLVDTFREKEGTWTGIALNEWLQENPLLLAELPPNLRSQESSLEVSERLRQLSIALKRNTPATIT